MSNNDELLNKIVKSLEDRFPWVKETYPHINLVKEKTDPVHYKKVGLPYKEGERETIEFVFKKEETDHTSVVRVLCDNDGNILKISVSR